jgi:hypothetical protein
MDTGDEVLKSDDEMTTTANADSFFDGGATDSPQVDDAGFGDDSVSAFDKESEEVTAFFTEGENKEDGKEENEEAQAAEAGNENEDKSEEPKEEEVAEETEEGNDAFNDFDFGDTAEAEPFIKELGLEDESIKTPQDLKNYITSLKQSQKAEEIADDDLRSHVENLKAVHSNNGDWTAYKGDVAVLASAKAELSAVDRKLKQLDSLEGNPDLNTYKQLLISDVKNSIGGKDKSFVSEFIDGLEEKSDYQIKSDAYAVINKLRSQIVGDRSKISEQVDTYQAKVDGAAEQARKDTEAAQARYSEAVESYKDDFDPRFSKHIQKEARRLFNSQGTTVRLPTKLVDYLFKGEDGKIDPSKLVELVGHSKFAKSKIKHALSKAKVDNFRKMGDVKISKGQDLSVGNATKSTGRNGGSAFDGAGGVEVIER